MNERDVAVNTLASRQQGIVTRRQALAAGHTSSSIGHRCRTHRWITVERGVYRISGAPDTWKSRLVALCFAFHGVASHRSAAQIHQVPGFDQDLIEISVPRGCSAVRDGVVMHESTDLFLFEPQIIDGVPTTPITRLVVDLGAVVRFVRYDQAVEHLIRRQRITWEEMFDQLMIHSRQGRDGVGSLRAELDLYFGSDVGDSRLENLFLRELRRRGLLEPTPQHKVYDHGVFIACVDYAYPTIEVAIELDSKTFHGPAVFEKDRLKRLNLVAAGWDVVEVTWKMLTGNPDALFRNLARIIGDRGTSTA